MKKIIIVGAGEGLSLGVAEVFGAHGFEVILIARNERHLEALAETLAEKNITVHTEAADASNFKSFDEEFAYLTEVYGVPDVLFYNVGVTVADEEVKVTPQLLVDRYKTDVVGAYNCIRLLDSESFAKNHGAILITGGGLAIEPHAAYLPLSMDKAALRAMVQALAPVLEEKGIFLGTIQVTGVIGSDEHFSPTKIAEEFYQLYTEQNSHEIIY